MAVAGRTVISFGLVAIPIAMYTAVQDNDISFNQLHKDDYQRIRYKKVCGHCGEEVKSEDIVKGYQYDKDHFVIVTDDDLEKIKTPKEKSIQILHFAQLNQISPIYYDKAYHVTPEAGGDKAFELLRRALMDSQKVAIGKTVMGSHETLMAIIPREDGMLLATMHFSDEIKDIPRSYPKPEITDQELAMARTLIDSMYTPFNPEQYHDEYQVKLRQLIEDKIAGKEIVAAESEHHANVIDLMEALKASIEQHKPEKPKRTPRKKQGA